MSDQEQHEEVVFHYNREGRLRRLLGSEHQRRGFFSKRRTRTLIVVLVDILLVAGVLYFINRPVDVYDTRRDERFDYEINVSEIKGNKVLIGFTIRNITGEQVQLPGSRPVVLEVTGSEGSFTRNRSFQESSLADGDRSSVVFLFDRDSLPSSASIRIYYAGEEPVFQKQLRF